ncbi:MAG: hypothetical protein M3Z64_08050 [Verrucomicrobiota bacterium]|nr:hypothetical protein [Verrucomicrobiota bacterium]
MFRDSFSGFLASELNFASDWILVCVLPVAVGSLWDFSTLVKTTDDNSSK